MEEREYEEQEELAFILSARVYLLVPAFNGGESISKWYEIPVTASSKEVAQSLARDGAYDARIEAVATEQHGVGSLTPRINITKRSISEDGPNKIQRLLHTTRNTILG